MTSWTLGIIRMKKKSVLCLQLANDQSKEERLLAGSESELLLYVLRANKQNTATRWLSWGTHDGARGLHKQNRANERQTSRSVAPWGCCCMESLAKCRNSTLLLGRFGFELAVVGRWNGTITQILARCLGVPRFVALQLWPARPRLTAESSSLVSSSSSWSLVL